MNPTEESGMSDNHHFGYEEHGGDLEVEVNATMGSEVVGPRDKFLVLSILVPLIFWQIKLNGLVVVPDFLLGTKRIRGMD